MADASGQSRLLEMLDAASDPRIELPQTAAAMISSELQQMIREYTLMLIDHDIPDEQQDRLLEQIIAGISEEPQGLRFFRSALTQSNHAEERKPVPRDLLERQMKSLLTSGTKAETTIRVIRGRNGLRHESNSRTRIARSYELARAASESVSVIRLIQRMTRCEIEMQVETSGTRNFILVIRLTYLDPELGDQKLTISLSDPDQDIHLSGNFDEQKMHEFHSVPPGDFDVQIRTDSALIDEIRIEFTPETDK